MTAVGRAPAAPVPPVGRLSSPGLREILEERPVIGNSARPPWRGDPGVGPIRASGRVGPNVHPSCDVEVPVRARTAVGRCSTSDALHHRFEALPEPRRVEMALDGVGELVTGRVECGGDGAGKRRESGWILEHAVHVETEHVVSPEGATVGLDPDGSRCPSDAVSDLVARDPASSEPRPRRRQRREAEGAPAVRFDGS